MDYMDDSSEMPAETQSVTEESGGDGDYKTALINSEVCPGKSVNDTFTVRVERVLDSGEYEVREVKSEEPAEEPVAESEPAPEMDYMG